MAKPTIEKTIEISYLYGFYAPMLTLKQQLFLDLYYNQDYSLSEIALQEGITRQGVRDAIKRGESAMRELEQKLKFAARYRELQRGLELVIQRVKALGPCAADIVGDMAELARKLED